MSSSIPTINELHSVISNLSLSGPEVIAMLDRTPAKTRSRRRAGLRRLLFQHPKFPLRKLAALAKTDADAALGLARYFGDGMGPFLSKCLAALAKHPDSGVVGWVAVHPCTPVETLRELAEVTLYAQKVVLNPAAPATVKRRARTVIKKNSVTRA